MEFYGMRLGLLLTDLTTIRLDTESAAMSTPCVRLQDPGERGRLKLSNCPRMLM